MPSARPVPLFRRHRSAQCQYFGRRRSKFKGVEGENGTREHFSIEIRVIIAPERVTGEFWSGFRAG